MSSSFSTVSTLLIYALVPRQIQGIVQKSIQIL